jgi:hypothetical protein
MVKRKKFNKAVALSVACLTLGVSLIASAIVFSSPFKKTSAGTTGGASQNHGGFPGGAQTVTTGDFISNSNMAYRIYFAENTMADNGVFDKTEQGFTHYESLYWFSTLAIYNAKNWDGNDPRAWGEIYTWNHQDGMYGNQIYEDDFNTVFGGVFGSSSYSLPAVNLQNAITSGNDWSPFISYCDNIKTVTSSDNNKTGLRVAFESYMDYINSKAEFKQTSLQCSALARLNEIYNLVSSNDSKKQSEGLKKLMLVCEPVFISQSANAGRQYTVSLSDHGYDGYYDGYYGGYLVEKDKMVASRIMKLNTLYTDFTMSNGNQANPPSGRWYGFFVYNAFNSEFDPRIAPRDMIPTSINVNIQYNGDLHRATENSSSETDVSVGHTIMSPSGDNENLYNWILDGDYKNKLKSWESIGSLDSAESHSVDPLYMAGNLEWKPSVFKGIPTTPPTAGAWKYQAFDSLLNAVSDDMKSKVSLGKRDYTLGLFGNLSSSAIDNVIKNNLFLTNTSLLSLQVADSGIGDISDLSGDRGKMQEVESYIQNNIQTFSQETPVPDTDKGYSFGNTISTGFSLKGEMLNGKIGSLYKTAYNASKINIEGVTEEINLPVVGDATGYGAYQGTPEDSLELLGKIQGATALSDGVVYDNITDPALIPAGANRAVQLSGGNIMVGITTMEKRVEAKNYLAFSRVLATGGSDSKTSYSFAEVGKTYDHGHTTQVFTTWYINDEASGGLVKNAGDDSNTFMLVWRNTDMKDNEDCSFENIDNPDKNHISQGAEEITKGIASYMQSSGQDLLDTKSDMRVKDAFKATTGIEPVSVVALGDEDEMSTSIQLGTVFDNDNNLSGYSVLVLTTGGNADQYTETGGNLPAHMLNIFSPSSWGMGSNINKTPYVISYRKKSYGGYYEDFKVTDKFYGDLYSMFGSKALFYNEEKGNFGDADDDTKWFEYGEKAYVSYAYTLPRSLWKDNLTICDYRGDGQNSNYQDFAESIGFRVGNSPKASGVTVGAGVEKVYPDTKHDTHRFQGDVWWETKKRSRHSSTTKTYKITHTMDKYEATDIVPKPIEDANQLFETVHEDDGRQATSTYKTALRNESDKTLGIYPEVNMLMQYTPYRTIESREDVDTLTDLYVFGDKLRKVKPISLRGITINGDAPEGQFSSDTVAVGSLAKSLQSSTGLPVTYTGGNINLHVDKLEDKINLLSYSLDLDEDYKNATDKFSSTNKDYKSSVDHEDFVDGTLSNLGVDITLDINTRSNGSGTKYRYNNFNTMASAFSIENTDTDSFKIYFKQGEIVKSGSEGDGYKSLINDIADEYDVSYSKAKSIFEDSGIEETLQNSFESSDDGLNYSHNEPTMEGDHWYDEQTSVFCISKYKTTVSLGELVLADKIDITLGNDGKSTALKQTADRTSPYSALYGKWYYTLYLKNDIETSSEDITGSQHEILIKEQPISDTDFIISSATTNDMRN